MLGDPFDFFRFENKAKAYKSKALGISTDPNLQ
jgi:hypothetical protein